MKELSIEKKAKAYDEALKEAVIAHKDEDRHLKATLERIFPELKESEDERIRKGIKSVLEHYKESGEIVCPYPFVSIDEALAWLENQESYYTFEIKEGHWYKCVCDYMLNGSDLMFKNDKLYYCRKDWRLRGEIDERNVKDIGVNGYKSFFRPATNQEIKDWLEKQGKQKHIKNIVETWKDMRLEVYQQASGNRHEPNYSDDTTKMFSLNDIDEIIEKMSEQNTADKVEPKFKVNEWVVTGINAVVQIKAVNNGHYTIDSGMEFNMPYVDRYWHKWTIQDAKDGDVLVASDGSIFLFGGVDDSACKYYAALTTDNYIKINKEAKGGYWETSRAVYPATKEQRDQLEKAMADAGYTFDFDKKELKKVEQKSTDNEMIEILRTEYEKGRADAIAEMQNTAWSEEDEMFVHGLIRGLSSKRDIHGHTTFSSDCIDITETINWLKSLKDRYAWKPSDEQMKALHHLNITGNISYAGQGQTLIELYNDLKKLKGE